MPIFAESTSKQAGTIVYEVSPFGCWDCISHSPTHGRTGHIKIRRGGRQIYIHRYVYLLTHGIIPDGMVIRHKCDNPKCINPDHLIVGTVADNNSDAITRGRFRSGRPLGRSNGSNRLSEDEVLYIRSSGEPKRGLARRFGVNTKTVYDIKSGKIWGWLT